MLSKEKNMMSTQSRLRLKKNTYDSSQNNVISNAKVSSENNDATQKNNSSQTSGVTKSTNSNNVEDSSADFKSPNKPIRSKSNNDDDNIEDSLADFKSPKQREVIKPLLSKFKNESNIIKKKIIKSKSKPNSKSKKSLSEANQPSIESSFFKPQTTDPNDIKESIPCLVCLKPFKDDITCTNHMKICAVKNKVSIHQLFEAKRLQERQAEERKAMGLLGTPILPEKKKAYRSKNFTTGDDPHLQLVLAMSESLYEAEQIEQLKQAALLEGIPLDCLKDMNDEDRKTTLKKFGFTTNKPVSEVTTNKIKKKKLLGPTILQTRSKEDKERVLTERIACILTGDDALTQAQKNTEVVSNEKSVTELRSQILKKIQQLKNKLWDRSRLTKNFDFYVSELKSHFLQLDTNLEHSQLLDSDSILKKTNNDNDQNILLNSSVVYEPIDIDVIINQDNEYHQADLLNMSGTENIESKNFEIDSIKSAIAVWRDTLNDSAASDVIIFVKNNKQIYGHKLVFHARCPNILLDIEQIDVETQPRIKEKISWLSKDQLAALAFLEFIYCGSISKNVSVFEQEDLLSQVKNLARTYRVKELFSYLRRKQDELSYIKLSTSKSVNNVISGNDDNQNGSNISKKNVENESIQHNNSSHFLKSFSFEMQSLHHSDFKTKHKSDLTPISHSLTKNNTNLCINNRKITMSPDLFDSENETSYVNETQFNNKTESNKNQPNLSILVNLIDDDGTNGRLLQTAMTQLNPVNEKTSDKSNQLSSQKTVINLSRSPSPRSCKSLDLSLHESIHEALTPPALNDSDDKMDCDHEEIGEAITPKKYRSPERVDKSPKVIINDISSAVTPDSNTLSRINEQVPQNTVYANLEDEDTLTQTPTEKNSNDDMYNAVTPPKSDKNYAELNKDNIKKIKSEISMIIEKVQKQNAKSALDTDSETDTPDHRRRIRNPFLKRCKDDSYAYLRDDGEQKEIPRRAISLLEKDILDDEKRMLECKEITIKPKDINNDKSIESGKFSSVNENLKSTEPQVNTMSEMPILKTKSNISKKTINCLTSDDEIQDITIDETEMSRYSKYKKFNKDDNSISKYREKLNFKTKQCSSKQEWISKQSENSISPKTTPKKILIPKASAPKSKTIIEDITLVSDSDDEELVTKSKLSNTNLSYQQNLTEESEKNQSKSKSISSVNMSNLNDDSTFPLDLVDDRFSKSQHSKIINSTALKEKDKNAVIDLSVDSEEEGINKDSTFPLALAAESDHSLQNKSSRNKNSSDKNKEDLKSPEKQTDDIEAELSKILGLSPDFSNVNENLSKDSDQDNNKKSNDDNNIKVLGDKINSKHQVLENLSPISIFSSPEDGAVNKTCDQSKIKNVNENNTIPNDYLDGIEFDSDWHRNSLPTENKSQNKSFQSDLETSTSKRKLVFDDANPKNSTPKSDQSSAKPSTSRKPEMSLITSPILSQNRRSSQVFHDKISKSQKSQRKERSQSPDLITVRKKAFVKSTSALDFTEKTRHSPKNNFRRSSSFQTPEQNQKSRICNDVVTPPVDYSILETPELQKELQKFGLRPQSRNKAKKLLSHIYNETHKLVSVSQKRESSTNSSSEDEEPPPKRKNTKTSSKTASKKPGTSKSSKNSEDCPMIAEEMDYDDPDAPNVPENPVSIKDAFFRLIETNKELYTKVLTYEPLPLESLHLSLKQTGIKCKINSLMDFLDEQCITFQVHNGKGSRTKKKKK